VVSAADVQIHRQQSGVQPRSVRYREPGGPRLPSRTSRPRTTGGGRAIRVPSHSGSMTLRRLQRGRSTLQPGQERASGRCAGLRGASRDAHPPRPVGLETAAFDVGVQPANGPGRDSDCRVLHCDGRRQPQWLAPTSTGATYDISTLIPRDTYPIAGRGRDWHRRHRDCAQYWLYLHRRLRRGCWRYHAALRAQCRSLCRCKRGNSIRFLGGL